MPMRLPAIDKSEPVLQTEEEHERALIAACRAATAILEARGIDAADEAEVHKLAAGNDAYNFLASRERYSLSKTEFVGEVVAEALAQAHSFPSEVSSKDSDDLDPGSKEAS